MSEPTGDTVSGAGSAMCELTSQNGLGFWEEGPETDGRSFRQKGNTVL